MCPAGLRGIVSYTAGAASTLLAGGTLGGAGATMTAGMTVLGGGAAVGGAAGAVAAGGLMSATAAGLAGAAIGGAVGSIAGQGFAMAAGMQSEFSWRQVGQSAIGAGITAGVGAGLNAMGWLTNGSAAVNAAGRAALRTGANLLRQEKWNWQTVMASAAGGAAGTLVGQALGNSALGAAMGPQGRQLAAGFAGGVVSGWAGPRGKADYLSVFASAAANSYGDMLEQPGGQRAFRDDSTLDLGGGPAPRPEAGDFYEELVRQGVAHQAGPAPSLADAVQYADARVSVGRGRHTTNLQGRKLYVVEEPSINEALTAIKAEVQAPKAAQAQAAIQQRQQTFMKFEIEQ